MNSLKKALFMSIIKNYKEFFLHIIIKSYKLNMELTYIYYNHNHDKEYNMEKYAVIDIGSNTVRVVVYEIISNKYKVILNNKNMLRLVGRVENNNLNDKDINKLVETLKEFKKIIDKHECKEIIVFATEILRIVENKYEIIDIVKKEVGLDIVIISGKEEARYGFEGVCTSHDVKSGYTVDFGGGSTDITYFLEDVFIDSWSIPVGSVVFKEMIANDIPAIDEMHQMKTMIYNMLKEKIDVVKCNLPLYAIGGCARNIARIDKYITGRDDTINGYEIDYKQIRRTREFLMLLNLEEIKRLPFIAENRADTIIFGNILFQTVYNFFNSNKIIVSRTGVREGALSLYFKEEKNINELKRSQ